MKKRDYIVSRRTLPKGLGGERRYHVTIEPWQGLGTLGTIIMTIGFLWLIGHIIWLMGCNGFEKERVKQAEEYKKHRQEVSEQREFVRRYNTPEQNKRLDEWENREPLNDWKPE